MNNVQNIHATCVSVNGSGVLFLGHSGSGKSDLALRLIGSGKAVLVADDRVDVSVENSLIKASAPESLKGLIEVRGIGICRVPFCKETTIRLAVELVDFERVERMPENRCFKFKGVSVPLVRLCAFEASVVDKIVIKLNEILDLTGKNFKL